MTKEETVKIMALLGAFYSGGKNDPKTQAQAWYMILYKYDYEVAKVAVLRYAENDTREYATFPAVGNIVQAIKQETIERNKPIQDIMLGVSYGRDYEQLSDEAHRLITAEQYKEWLKIDAQAFQNDSSHYADILRGVRNNLLGDDYGRNH